MHIIINKAVNDLPEEAVILASSGSPSLNLLNSLNYDNDNPPLGELLSAQHGLEGSWVILSPIHWTAGHNNAVISSLDNEITVSEDELRSCFQLLSEYFFKNNMALYYHNSHTWLLSTNYQSVLLARPLPILVNKPLMGELASMDKTMYWQKVLTECQMLLTHKKPGSIVNGVWIWGSGSLTEKKTQKIVADSVFISLAQLCSSHVNLYQANSATLDCDILIVDDLASISNAHQDQLKKKSTSWYWNNQAYQSLAPKTNRFTRLWRAFINAH